MFNNTEFNVIKNGNVVGTILCSGGKYYLAVHIKHCKNPSKSTHRSFQDACDTAYELLQE
jgi:hypothetical protein|nr:MAG TPA: hypothetical protein [Caudoviricetes sp.]